MILRKPQVELIALIVTALYLASPAAGSWYCVYAGSVYGLQEHCNGTEPGHNVNYTCALPAVTSQNVCSLNISHALSHIHSPNLI